MVAVQGEEGKEWPEDCPLPEPPLALLDVWNWYWDLRSSGSVGFSGPNPLSYSEIQTWATLMQIDVTPSIVRYFRLMDSTYLDLIYKQIKADAPKAKTRSLGTRRK